MRILTIEEAVNEYMPLKWNESTQDYSLFLDDIIETYGEKFKRVSGRSGLLEFFNVRLALDSYRLWDIYDPDTANGIVKEIVNKHLLKAVDGEINKNMLSNEFSEYFDLVCQDFDESNLLANSKHKRAPLHNTTKVFIERLLEENIKEFEVKSKKDTAILSPLLIAQCCQHLIRYKISWMAVKDNLKIR